ncbi:MAG: F-box/SEL1-like repeat protein [Alphaproteobacteria bacterium]|nr:F-box/SEL1-like repeat protein [Alphaproteobacteria bacterium]
MHLFIIAPLLSCLMFTIISESSCLASETPPESYESMAKRLRVTTLNPFPSRHSEEDILPEELLIIIFNQLNFRDLGAVQLVCKQWYRLGGDEILSLVRHIYKKPLSEVLWKLETIKEGQAKLSQEITALVSNQATGEKFFDSPDATRKLLLAPKAVEYVLRTPSLIPLLFKSEVTASELHHTLDRKTLDEDQRSALKTFVKSGSNLSSTINWYSEECINFTKDFAPHYKAWYLLYLFDSPQSEEPMHGWFRSIYAHITSEHAYENYSEDQALFIPKSLSYFSDLPYYFTQALGLYCHRWAKKSSKQSSKNLWLSFAGNFFSKYIIQEDTQNQLNLGLVLRDQGKFEAAVFYLRNAANQGDTVAQITLGKLLSNQRNYEEAEVYSRKAADKGAPNAQGTLGQILFNQKKYEEAKGYLRKAADGGDTTAQVTLGLILVNQHKDEEAEVYLRKAADKGATTAQSRLGRILFNQKKFEEAEFYLRKAADRGDTQAQTTLGVILSYQQKYEEAEFYLRKTADRGDTNAQSTLGVILFYQQKYREAEFYLRKAANKEDTNAQLMLGKLLSLLKKA